MFYEVFDEVIAVDVIKCFWHIRYNEILNNLIDPFQVIVLQQMSV